MSSATSCSRIGESALEEERRDQHQHQPGRHRTHHRLRRVPQIRVLRDEPTGSLPQPQERREQQHGEDRMHQQTVAARGEVTPQKVAFQFDSAGCGGKGVRGEPRVTPGDPQWRTVPHRQPEIEARRCGVDGPQPGRDRVCHRIAAATELELPGQWPGERAVRRLDPCQDLVHSFQQRWRYRSGLRLLACCYPGDAPLRELRSIGRVTVELALRFALPGRQLTAVELPVPLQAFEPYHGHAREIRLSHASAECRHARSQCVDLRSELFGRIGFFDTLQHVLGKLLIRVGARGYVTRGQRCVGGR